MLKVVHIIPTLGRGGAERITIDICNMLGKRPDVKVKLIVLSSFNEYSEYIKDLDVHFINVDLQLSIWKKNKLDLNELDAILDEFQPDVIHTHLFIAELIGHAKMRKGVRYISHFHDNAEQLKKTPGLPATKRELTNSYERRWIMKRYLNGDCKFITISKDCYSYFKQNLTVELIDNISYLPNAVNASRFLYHPKEKIHDPVRLISCGSFLPRKNQAFLIDCLYEIRKRGINATFTFLGDGPLLEKVKLRSVELGLSDYVFFLGNVNDPEEYYKKADVYFHGASYEAFGLVLIEAMLSGLPVITLDGKGNRELLINGKNGFVIDEQDPVIFYEKLMHVIDPEHYSKMSKDAMEFGKKFDMESYIEKLMIIYTG